MKRTALCVLLLFTLIAACSTLSKKQQTYCPICSMNLEAYWGTHHRINNLDGSKTGYCSFHCAAENLDEKIAQISQWQVADYATANLIDAKTSFFLVGSDLPGTMTPVSKLAFADRETAEKYKKNHGGKIVNFEAALQRTIESRGDDLSMIRTNVKKRVIIGQEMVQQHGCLDCHGSSAKSPEKAWDSHEFAQKMDSRMKIKEAILSGSHKVQNYSRKIPEKELHSITLYLWDQRKS
ncbi:MAG: hypothetical protein GY874_03020 [Desulfobacteraceae bacterium]|nr:hypothetical protein [Desulfobacteraceae bacterium]